MCTYYISSGVLIDTLYQHPDRFSVDTRLTFDQQSVDSQPSVDGLIYNDNKLVDCQLTGVPIKCQLRCRWSVDQVSIKPWLRVN